MMPDEPEEEMNAGDFFMSHIHDLLEGGRLVATDAGSIRVGDTDIPMTILGIAYLEDEVISYFALALNSQLADLLEIAPPLCPTCLDEAAAEILDGVDLDAELSNLRHDHPHDKTDELGAVHDRDIPDRGVLHPRASCRDSRHSQVREPERQRHQGDDHLRLSIGGRRPRVPSR